MTSSTKFRGLGEILVPRTHLSFPGLQLRDSSRGWYVPGRSLEGSQASGSDKLAGGSKHNMFRGQCRNVGRANQIAEVVIVLSRLTFRGLGTRQKIVQKLAVKSFLYFSEGFAMSMLLD